MNLGMLRLLVLMGIESIVRRGRKGGRIWGFRIRDCEIIILIS